MKRIRAFLFVFLIAVISIVTLLFFPVSEICDVYAGYGGGLRGLLLTLTDSTTIAKKLDDNVWLHDRWIDLFGGMQRLTGVDVIANPNASVYRLRGNRVTVVLADYGPFSDTEKDSLQALKQAAEDVSARSLFVVIPRKTCSLQKEFVSRGIQTHSEDIDNYRAGAFAEAGFDILDLHKTMHAQGKDHASMYFRTDHHWTSYAGFWAAKEIGDALGADTSLLELSQFETEKHPGMFLGSEGKRGGRLYCAPDDLDIPIPTFDTAMTLRIDADAPRSGSFREALLFPERFMPKPYADYFPYSVFLNGDYSLVSIQNMRMQGGMKVLLIRDSFTNCMAPYLALCCAQVDLIDMRSYEDSVFTHIAEMCPDAVCVTMTSAVENKHFCFE